MRVVLSEDSTLLREGLARLLTEADMEVVGRCADAKDLKMITRTASRISKAQRAVEERLVGRRAARRCGWP